MYKWQLEDVTFSLEQMIEAQDQDYFFFRIIKRNYIFF